MLQGLSWRNERRVCIIGAEPTARSAAPGTSTIPTGVDGPVTYPSALRGTWDGRGRRGQGLASDAPNLIVIYRARPLRGDLGPEVRGKLETRPFLRDGLQGNG